MATESDQIVAAGQIRQDTIVPWLAAAPRLVHSLGWCMSFAATREVARIRLSTDTLRSTDLSTNLVQIADEGQNAFMDAYTDLLDISNGTRSMTRENGYFDRLEDALGKSDGDRATTRALARICETVDECERNGKRTAHQFKAWRKTVQNVERAVINTQRTTEADIYEVGKDMKEIKGELRMQEVILNQKAAEVQDAKKEYQRILKQHAEREKILQEFTDRAVTCATLGLTAGMFGSVLAATGSAALLAFSGDRASTLETELQRKARVSHELEEQMEKARNALNGKMSDEDRLSVAVQKKMSEIIIVVCQLLGGLCNDILILLTQFARLNSTIKQLVREHKETKQIVRDLRDDLDDDDNDDGTMPEMNQRDYNTFRDQMFEMRKLSVEINSMSSLYAEVIVDVINPGFSKVVEAAYEDGGESNTSIVMYNKQSGMNDYLVEAQGICVARERAADAALRKALSDIDTSYLEERTRRQEKARKDAKKRGVNRENTNGNVRRSFMSRVFSRD